MTILSYACLRGYFETNDQFLGGTATDRPEDIEISPFDNTLFVCHTNNDTHGNIHGHMTRYFEKGNDLGAMEFDFEIFAAGGRQSGFSAPDNITFDSNGDVWTVTDMSGSSMNKGVFTEFGNNGVYVIPSSDIDVAAPRRRQPTAPCRYRNHRLQIPVSNHSPTICNVLHYTRRERRVLPAFRVRFYSGELSILCHSGT
jgi:hypothetical protein